MQILKKVILGLDEFMFLEKLCLYQNIVRRIYIAFLYNMHFLMHVYDARMPQELKHMVLYKLTIRFFCACLHVQHPLM